MLVSDVGVIGRYSQPSHDNSKNKKQSNIWWAHMPVSAVKKQLGNNIFNNYFTFTIVRNPYDMVVSRYFFQKKTRAWCKDMSFKDWVKQLKKEKYTNYNLYSIDDKPVCDFYIRYETLKDDIETVLQKLGIIDYDLHDLPVLKGDIRDKNIHYREYYDNETKKIVEEIMKKEFDMFGYKFDK